MKHNHGINIIIVEELEIYSFISLFMVYLTTLSTTRIRNVE
jgi:hypothetical protein